MVILIVTRDGYEEMKPLIFSGLHPVWVGADVLHKNEIDSIRSLGINITNFSYSINPANSEQVESALNTINEHHPQQRIWLEWIEEN